MPQSSPALPPTRAQWTDDLLRAEIYAGELSPGDRVHVERLAEKWGVSPTPIRESVRRLAGEGLISLTPQRGARVALVDSDKAAEIYAVRILLEPVAIRQSMECAQDDYEFIRAIQEPFDLMNAPQNFVEFQKAHRSFHLAIVARCPNVVLRDEVTRLHDMSRLFQFATQSMQRQPDPMSEHINIIEAVFNGNIELVVRLQTEHLTNTLLSIQSTHH
jgi:DNA-binding GntR family transcriptional regulator